MKSYIHKIYIKLFYVNENYVLQERKIKVKRNFLLYCKLDETGFDVKIN